MNCTKGVQTGRRWLIGSMNLCYRLNADFYVRYIISLLIQFLTHVLTLLILIYYVPYGTGTGSVIKKLYRYHTGRYGSFFCSSHKKKDIPNTTRQIIFDFEGRQTATILYWTR